MNAISKLLLPAPFLLPMLPSTLPSAPEALAIVEDESLADLRAGGRLALAAPLTAEEHERLVRAQADAEEDLVDLRGGDISNSELTTIVLVLAIVALIVIIV